MKNKPYAALSALLLLPVLVTPLSAADSVLPDGKVDVEVFRGPKLLTSQLNAKYPGDSGEEGWVQLNFMVSPSGKAYEATVIDSSGETRFEKAALGAIGDLRYQPATRGKTPVDSSQDLVIVFTRGQQSARVQFAKAHDAAIEAIEKEDRAAADEALEKLSAKNLYEGTHHALALYRYHLKWGTETEQLDDLHRALRFESAPSYFSKRDLALLYDGMLRLELKQHEYGNSLVTWSKLQKVGNKDEVSSFQDVMSEVDKLRRNDARMGSRWQIVRGSSWHGHLFKHRFEILVTEGHVSEIKLRCEKHYLFFPYEPGVRYEVSAGDGLCGIEVIGERGTKFDLLES